MNEFFDVKPIIKKTTVVHVRKYTFDVYIGRAYAEFPQSKWHNPYHIGKDGNREEVIRKFDRYLTLEMVEEIKAELKGKVLGCWCKPDLCHGDILARIANNEEDFHDWNN